MDWFFTRDYVEPAIPFFLALVVLEQVVSARRRVGVIRGYAWRDTAASLAMGIGSLVVGLALKGATFGLYVFCYDHRFFELGTGPLVFALAILLDDLGYYWFHRLHHEIRILWAAHVNHHSSTHYNLSTALRQSWTTFTSPLFYLPLPLFGIDPLMVLSVHSMNLLYQFWIHTEHIDRLGPLEVVMNTPSHHRVHHGRNVRYLDRNYAGIFIFWDKLFGSFQPETERVDYGITKNLTSFNPFWIAFHEWVAIGRDVWRAGTLRDAVGYVLKRPGWSPDGSTRTAPEMQRELATAAASAEARAL